MRIVSSVNNAVVQIRNALISNGTIDEVPPREKVIGGRRAEGISKSINVHGNSFPY